MKNNSSGFTLLEVLIALSIVSLVFASFLLSLSEIINHTTFLKEKTIAALVANNIMIQARLGKLPLSNRKEVTETLLMANMTCHWTLQKDDTSNPWIKKIAITIKDPKEKTIHQLTGFLYERKS